MSKTELSKVVSFRVTLEEYGQLCRFAGIFDMTLSEFIKTIVIVDGDIRSIGMDAESENEFQMNKDLGILNKLVRYHNKICKLNSEKRDLVVENKIPITTDPDRCFSAHKSRQRISFGLFMNLIKFKLKNTKRCIEEYDRILQEHNLL